MSLIAPRLSWPVPRQRNGLPRRESKAGIRMFISNMATQRTAYPHALGGKFTRTIQAQPASAVVTVPRQIWL